MECEFRKYAIFDGTMKDFRQDGGVVKTEDEKRQMAEKHRFKKNREFKKRLDEDEENAEADIRSFKFRSMERQGRDSDRRGGDRRGGKFQDNDDERGSYKRQGGFAKGGFSKGGKPGKSNRKFSNKRNFDDED